MKLVKLLIGETYTVGDLLFARGRYVEDSATDTHEVSDELASELDKIVIEDWDQETRTMKVTKYFSVEDVSKKTAKVEPKIEVKV